jgi:hypothetical protein
MNQRCATRTTRTGGARVSSVALIRTCQEGAASALGMRCRSPITAVDMLFSVVTRSGQRYWFQDHKKRMIAIATMFDRDSGSRISQKNCIGRAPSTRAASESSSGTVRKNCRNRKVAVAEAISGRIKPE